MVLGGSCPGGNCPRGSCPIGVIVLRGSCPRGSCPQGSCPRGSCPRGSCPVTDEDTCHSVHSHNSQYSTTLFYSAACVKNITTVASSRAP